MLEFMGSFGQPTYCLGIVKTARVDIGQKLSMYVVCKIFLELMAWNYVEKNC